MLGNTRFERSWGGNFVGVALVFLCPQGTEMERVDGGASGGLGGNAYGARRARLREPATSVASKKSDDNSPSPSISSIESMGD